MSEYTIYHNPRCKKSREALQMLEDKGVSFDVVQYLKEVPTKEELKKILAKLNVKPFDLVRKEEKKFKEEYKKLNLNDEEWIEVMHQNPKLIQRPVVVKGNRAVIGRPPENVNELF
ncbi:arsenate reductase (glutaredoxin) [Salibacter sp.]|uniref:arsenate reductase (glutaredoxin) n=1 Tax=Salibacter sp. TaxID=2010995 RepID=UPI002870AFE1|nr:arsenate reductase (glutaredoxin) [Salibacter sp.]MDR9397786.1 arsenate reductase (glutaredoxin) [Salibacter sp.]MDR9487129.1 arsenate reductase (glutaredoxin) [Salibacter sp.]